MRGERAVAFNSLLEKLNEESPNTIEQHAS